MIVDVPVELAGVDAAVGVSVLQHHQLVVLDRLGDAGYVACGGGEKAERV